MKKQIKATCFVLCVTLLFAMFLSPFEPISKAATDYGLSNPKMTNDISTWDCIWFGNYYQNNDKTKEPVKWRVLSVNGDDAFLLADKVLDCQQYNSDTRSLWENCTLRKWLNEDFYNTAFSYIEQDAIKTTTVVDTSAMEYDAVKSGNDTNDKIYLLSITEVTNPEYGFSNNIDSSETRISKNTKYASSRDGISTSWLTRSRESSWAITRVDSIGRFDYSLPLESYLGVRPVLHLDLSSSVWSKADPVTSGSDNSESEKPKIPDNFQSITQTTQTGNNTPNKIADIAKVTSSKTTIATPDKVKNVKAKNNKKRTVTLSWSKVKKAKGYQVQYVKSGSFTKKNIYTKKTKVQVKKLTKKKKYSFRVRAYVLDGKKKKYGKWSSVKKVKIKK